MLPLDRQNAYRDRYAADHPGWRRATEVYEAAIRARLRSAGQPGLRVLDIGCGRGGVLEQLGMAVNRPFGIDPDGKSLVAFRLPAMPRAQALADAIPLPAASCDLVTCSWVLEHLIDPPVTFSEVARVLKPGGCFISLTPNARALVTFINRTLRPAQHLLVRRLYGRAESDTFPVQYRANTRAQLDRLAADAGLIADETHAIADPSYLAFTPWLYAISAALSWVTPPVHLVSVYRRK